MVNADRKISDYFDATWQALNDVCAKLFRMAGYNAICPVTEFNQFVTGITSIVGIEFRSVVPLQAFFDCRRQFSRNNENGFVGHSNISPWDG